MTPFPVATAERWYNVSIDPAYFAAECAGTNGAQQGKGWLVRNEKGESYGTGDHLVSLHTSDKGTNEPIVYVNYTATDTTPPVITNLADSTGGGTNKTSDTTPTITLDTDEIATCNLSITNTSNWVGFTTTGGTSHIGTVSDSFPLVIGYPQNVYVNCSDPSLNSAYALIQYNITDAIPPTI